MIFSIRNRADEIGFLISRLLSLSKIPLAEFRGLGLNLPSMESSTEYLVVSGSLRSKSRSREMAHFLTDCYRSEGIVAQMIDLRDLPLPFCDGEAAYDDRSVLTVSKTISEARVVIIATPIYNFDASAALKNLIELTGESWEDKVVGFLCAAGGSMSYMSVMSLANSLMLDFRCLIIPRIVYATSQDFTDGCLSSSEVRERVRELAVASTRIRNSSV
jgi:NAD(P)H-dependent FMN reductase